MAGTQRLLTIAMAFLLAGSSGSGKLDALGMVVRADHASSGSLAATEGTTIYDGDRLSTDAGGSLQLQAGEAILYLKDQSCVTVHRSAVGAAKAFEAELVSGAVVLSVAKGTEAEIVASSARVRSTAEPRGVVQVRMVGPYELIVFAERGPAEISYHGESETIAEGKTYRVLLNPDEDGAEAERSAKRAGKRGKMLLLIAASAAAVTGIVLLSRGGGGGTTKGVESPDHP